MSIPEKSRITVLPGPTAAALSSAFIYSFLAVLVSLGGLVATAAIRDDSPAAQRWGTWQSDLFIVVCVVLIAAGLATITAMFMALSKTRAEVAAGYSTAVYQQAAVVVIDPKTKKILREKDAKPLRNRRDVAAARSRAL